MSGGHHASPGIGLGTLFGRRRIAIEIVHQLLIHLFCRVVTQATLCQKLFNNLLFTRFFRRDRHILPLRNFLSGQQVINVKTVLRVFYLADDRIVFPACFQRLMPVALKREGFTLAAGVGLQPVFHHLLLRLHRPAQLLLAHLVMRFLQVAAKLLADFSGQRRHHDQQDQHHQQGHPFLFA